MVIPVVKFALFVCYFSDFASALDVNGKLNFQDNKAISSFTQQSQPEHFSTKLLKRRQTADVNSNNKDEFSNIGVVCISGGCNTTTKSADDSSVVQTDVLVRVKTKINNSKNGSTETKKILEETPDIPVYVGYKGTSGITLDQNDNNPAVPILINNNQYDNNNYNARRPSHFFYPNTPSFTRYNYNNYYNNDANKNTYYSSRYYPSTAGVPNSYYPPSSINNNPDTLIITKDSQIGNNDQDVYQRDGVELRVPYFEPSYSTHYHGESPPPQYVTVSRKFGNGLIGSTGPRSSVSTNSFISDSGYKNSFTNNNSWRPSVYNIKDLLVPQRRIGTGTATNVNCLCQNGHSHGVLVSDSNRRISGDDPGTQINDKLAPLN